MTDDMEVDDLGLFIPDDVEVEVVFAVVVVVVTVVVVDAGLAV